MSQSARAPLSLSLLLSTIVSIAFVGAALAAPGDIETVVLFDPIAMETPESVVVDRNGDIFIGSAFTAEIFKLTPDGELSVFAALPLETPGIPCFDGGFPALLGALALDSRSNLYGNFAACEATHRGVWRISASGKAERIVELGFDVLPNGLALVGDRLYIADSLGSILVAPANGGAPALWSADPMLAEDPEVFGPGPNGIQFFDGELYVANSDTAQILAFELNEDGSAGRLRIHSQLPFGCDDFAFDRRGAILCTTDPANVVLEVEPDGKTIHTILDVHDGLDGPTAAAFGRTPSDRLQLYVANAAFPFFTVANRPSLMRIELEYPGLFPIFTDY